MFKNIFLYPEKIKKRRPERQKDRKIENSKVCAFLIKRHHKKSEKKKKYLNFLIQVK